MPNVHFSFRRGAGDVPEILYGKVEIKPTLAFARGTSLVLPAPTTLDLVNGEATANNVYPTPAPIAGQVEWAYRVKAIDTRGQSFEWMVGVPDSTGTVEFASLPRYFETKPPLFGKGEKGDPGEAATIQIGTTTSGTTPSVTNSGTNKAAILNFVLPKGDKGDRGDGVPAGGTALQYLRKDAAGVVTEWATLNKASVGLSNVDNTSDADKPVSTATQTAINSVIASEDNRVADLVNQPTSATSSAITGLINRGQVAEFNVRHFGAVGDGVTDDTQAIQDTFDAMAAAGGGIVVFPPGDYWPKNTIKLPRQVGFDILGRGWPILRRKNGDPNYALFAGLSEGNRGYGSGASNFTCSGIEFRGSFKVGAARSLGAFALHHSQNAIIENNRFIECHSKGHVFDLNGCDNILIRNNVFKGMWIDDGNGVAEAIQFDQSKNGSLSYADLPGSYDGLMTRNITIENNEFLPYVDADGIWYPASNIGGNHTTRQGVYYENIKILGNYVEDPIQPPGVNSIRGNIHLQGTRGIIIKDNKFVSTRGGNATMIALITVVVGNDLNNDPEVVTPVSEIPPQGCIDAIIEGNTFYGFKGTKTSDHLVRIDGVTGSNSALKNITIAKNIFRDNFTSTASSNPMYVSCALDVEVSQNKLLGSNYRVVYIDSVDNISIGSNCSGSSAVQPYWVQNSTRVSFQGNSWSGVTNVSRIKDSVNVTVSNNICTSPAASALAFVLEGCKYFLVTSNNFYSSFGTGAGIALAGSNNSNGYITDNTLFGYASAIQGTGTSVTVGTNIL